MKFGEVPVDEAEGAVLAHSLRLPGGVVKKGRVLDAGDLARLREDGVGRVAVARLEAGDLGENEAARRVASALASAGLEPSGPSTGRVNLSARASGVIALDEERVHRLNGIDEAIAVATVPPLQALSRGQLAATVKIVTFGVSSELVDACVRIAGEPRPAIRLHPYRPARAGLLQTLLPGARADLAAKTAESVEARLRALGCRLDEERRCAHAEADVAEALGRLADGGCGIILVMGASAAADRRDVVPRALERAGGRVEHLGMPVDPGHLTLLARLGGAAVLALPGSARSPRLHGFDWILQRLVAGLDVTPDDVARMGVGGLLKEIPGRPVPRERGRSAGGPAGPARVGALLLAAGQSRRMGRINKMVAEVDGEPMVVRAARALVESRADPVVVVLGHEPDRAREALSGLGVRLVRNPAFEAGLSTSLRAGLEALPADSDAAVVALGDMPRVSAADVDALIDAFDPDAGAAICVPTHGGKRGNPVLWARRYFPEMGAVSGDVGARHLIGENADQVREVPRPGRGVLVDLDTPDALSEARGGG